MPRQYADLLGEDAAAPFTDALMELRADELGLDIDAADDRTLQLDLDTMQDRARFVAAHALLVSIGERCENLRITDGSYVAKPSKSGDGQHVWIKLMRPLTAPERIALQACLGSDASRELLSLAGVWAGKQRPIVLFRPKETP